MVTWLRLVGWDAQQLANGYKSYRGHVIELVDHLVPQLRLQVLCGATGSAKTRVLHALAEAGEQVLDLEGYARHKGSLLGNLPGVEQPSQKYFETLLAQQLERFDLSRPVYVEGESVKIGRISLPLVLVEHMRQSSVIEIDATPQARLDYLLRDYAYLGDDPQALADKLAWLKELQGREAVSRWQAWAHERSLSPLFSELMAQHYDPHYQRSQERHFTQWRTRRTVQTADLSEAGIAELARQILVLDAASAV
jgi:tRNA 2-selenouridine synthase